MAGGLEEQVHQKLLEMVLEQLDKYGLRATPGSVVSGSYSSQDRTIKVQPYDGGPPVKVNLQAIRGGDTGFLQIPKDDSMVVIGYYDESSAFLIMTSEIDRIELDCEEIVINGGNNGEIAIYKELKKELDKNKAVLDTILQVLNGGPITEPGNGANSALQTALSTALAGKQTGDFGKTSIKDDNIKH